ncbi:MAG: hypothetical protein ABJC09_07700 [Terriglobia bacterium]
MVSPCLKGKHGHQILIQRDYVSAAGAYNDAIERADNDLMIFVHQDMIFPDLWLSQLNRALDQLEASDPRWGAVGCYGMTQDGVGCGCIYSPGRGVIGKPLEFAAPVQTLDEIVLIFKRSSGLRFDINLPHFHLYGTDICLRALTMGMQSYVIPAFCVHNAHQYIVLPKEYYECCSHIKRVWREALPIYTTCVSITGSGIALYGRRLREAYLRHIRHKAFLAPRAKDVSQLLKQAAASMPGM